MTEKLQNLIKEKIRNLPKEGQEAINTLDWVKITEEIGKRHLLDENKTSFLIVETLFVLVGIENGDLYASNIENEVGTSKERAEKIANEIFEKIFEPITDIIEENIKKNLQGKNTSLVQNANFILSGGDYSVFLESNSTNSPHPDPLIDKVEGGNQKIAGYTADAAPKIMDMKNKFLYDNEKGQ